MAATSTLKTIIEDLVERTGIGMVIPSFTGTTTTLTLTTTGSSELRGPFTGKRIPIGSPIVITAGGTPLEDTFVSDWVPSTGVITVSPAITTGSTDAVLIYADSGIDHGDRVVEAVRNAYKNHVSRWIRMPLTYVPGGNITSGVATYWTASAGTASYEFVSFPEVAAGRVLQLTHSASATVTCSTIPAHAGEVWEFETAIQATTASGVTAGFVVVDVTNTSTITPTFQRGDGDTTSNAMVTQRGQFTVPSNCDQIAFRLTLSASGTVRMAPIVAYPRNAMTFPLPTSVLHENRIGNFYYSLLGSTDNGPEERAFTGPITVGGREYRFSHDNDHLNVTFNFNPAGPIYYDELVYGLTTGLAAMTTTSTYPEEQIVRWAKFELYNRMWELTERKGARLSNGAPVANPWRNLRNNALKEARYSGYEPELKNVVGRR